ncbi:hypothetical protein ACSSS7_008440 [Eimeria intestinalis]
METSASAAREDLDKASHLDIRHQVLHQAPLARQPPEVQQQILGRAEGRMPVTQQQPFPQHEQHNATQVAAESQQLRLLAQSQETAGSHTGVGLTIQARS